LTCSDPALPTDSGNLVFRAAALFLEASGIKDGLRIHLEKNLPLAAGLGGGSANAAITLNALNDLFDRPLSREILHSLCAKLGSDIPFFLQSGPALVTGRGEGIQPLDAFPALSRAAFLLIHPGFGVSTAWAYKELAKHPAALNGKPGLAVEAVKMFQGALTQAAPALYNSLEVPVLPKYPLLELFQNFFREKDVPCLMSGSGSTTFAIARSLEEANHLAETFKARFGESHWISAVACASGLHAA
jgi:4-diphosphocytidyl-2-C-methyl-D-erythritol kinase